MGDRMIERKRVYVDTAELVACFVTDRCPVCGKPVRPAAAEVFERLAPDSTLDHPIVLDRTTVHRSCLSHP